VFVRVEDGSGDPSSAPPPVEEDYVDLSSAARERETDLVAAMRAARAALLRAKKTIPAIPEGIYQPQEWHRSGERQKGDHGDIWAAWVQNKRKGAADLIERWESQQIKEEPFLDWLLEKNGVLALVDYYAFQQTERGRVQGVPFSLHWISQYIVAPYTNGAWSPSADMLAALYVQQANALRAGS